MRIVKADRQDLKDILELQYMAYRSEAEIYNNYNIQPLRQTLKQLEEEFDQQVILKAEMDGLIVGSVRAFVEQGTCYIGKLIVHPEYQNKGIGTTLMNEVETYFNGCLKFQLFTGDKSLRNLHLYTKLGYKEFKSEEINANLKIIYLEKEASRDNILKGGKHL